MKDILRSGLRRILQCSVFILVALLFPVNASSALDVEIVTSPPPDASPMAPAEFEFKATVKGGEAKSFYWDFGDELDKEPCEDEECFHEFKKYGTYHVTLTVTDKADNKVVKTVDIKDIKKRPGCPF